MRGLRSVAAALLCMAALTACSEGRTRLVVRTDLPDEVRERVEASFEEANPEIDLRFSVDDDEATRAELAADEAARFDVWWGGPSSSLEALARDGKLAGWAPWASSPFVIVFDRDRVSLVDAPREWIDVLHHGWAEDVLVPDPTRSDVGAAFVLGAVAEAAREEEDSYIGFEWLERIDRQVVRYVPDEEEAIRGVRMETASLAIVSLAAFEARRAGEETLHHRRPESRDAELQRGVALVRTGGPAADAGARFVSFVTGAAGRAVSYPPGWTAPVGEEQEEIAMVADSASLWLTRWRETVRGRGK